MSLPNNEESHARSSMDAEDLGPASSQTVSDDPLLNIRKWSKGLQAFAQFEARGQLADLETAIRSYREATELTTDDSPYKVGILGSLATALYARFLYDGGIETLEEAITLERSANALTPDDSPEKPSRLSNLATSIVARFEQQGKPEDLEDAIALQSLAVELSTDDHTDRSAMLNNLGTSLFTRYGHLGEIEDLEKAIVFQGRAVDLTPDNDSDKPMGLINLGNSFLQRFNRLGDLSDLEKAIALNSRAVDLTPDDHPNKSGYMNDAGLSLWTRFLRLGNLEDLENAIILNSRAVELSPDSHTGKPSQLSNLAGELEARYERTRDLRDLEKAVNHQIRAVKLTPDGHPNRPTHLYNLGAHLQKLFEHSENPDDVDDAIAYHTAAVQLTPEGHPDASLYLHGLGDSLWQRFRHGRDTADLETAIGCATLAMELLPENHPTRARALRLLGLLHEARFRSTHIQGDESDATNSMRAYVEAMHHTASPPIWRLRASLDCADLLNDFPHLFATQSTLTSLGIYDYALDLIPQCVWMGNNVRGRYASNEMQIVGQAVNAAATAAIAAEEYGLALKWLESGRAIVWSQVLQLRTPLDDLRQLHPNLANDLDHVSQALQRAADPSHRAMPTKFTPRSLDTEAESSHSYAVRYNDLIAQIRELEGFESFLQPKPFSQLVDACAAGPVVVIHVHESQCDALVLHDMGQITHIPLPNLSYDHAHDLQTRLWTILKDRRLLSRSRSSSDLQDEELGGTESDKDNQSLMEETVEWRYPFIADLWGHVERWFLNPFRAYVFAEHGGGAVRGGRVTAPDEVQQMHRILADLWNLVVKPITDVVRDIVQPESLPDGVLPHVTWCPTGPLVFLPLHAAGIYAKDSPSSSQTVMDIVVSSYTPTLEALIKPRKTMTSAEGAYPKTLVVSQPATPGCPPISGTTVEAAIVVSLLGQSTDVLNDSDGTVDAVLEGMETHEWVHLACHGLQRTDDPTQSSFALHDGRLTLATLMSKHIRNADLAVLSACQTATGDEKLAEEAVHLAAGMLNVGYKSVVGTMWSISDVSAPIVMEEFYKVMAEQVKAGGELQPAYALHAATKVLREKKGMTEFLRWVPFIHFGL